MVYDEYYKYLLSKILKRLVQSYVLPWRNGAYYEAAIWEGGVQFAYLMAYAQFVYRWKVFFLLQYFF